MGHTINVSVRNKIAVAQKDALYICGNSDFVVVFDFDDEWAGYDAKTARFKYNGTHQDIVFTGNECNVPIISGAYSFEVGVFAGDLHTTTPAYVSAKKSILCGDGVPEDPPEDVYNQIMELLNKSGHVGVGVPPGGKAGQILKKRTDKDYEIEWGDFEIPEQYGLVTYDQDKTITIT